MACTLMLTRVRARADVRMNAGTGAQAVTDNTALEESTKVLVIVEVCVWVSFPVCLSLSPPRPRGVPRCVWGEGCLSKCVGGCIRLVCHSV